MSLNPDTNKHVVVLLGGYSSERDVSLQSGAACADALEKVGYRVTRLDMPRNIADFLQLLPADTDVIFNALHGRFGEDGCVQSLLDIMGIPYTHSGRLASALAMDKPMAKIAFAAAGIPVVTDKLVSLQDMKAGDPLPRPYVVKPYNEGSSVGVQIVNSGDHLPDYTAETWPFGEKVMVESFIPGREITVGVMDDPDCGAKAIGSVEICPNSGFYDYTAKYTEGQATHIAPAPLPPAIMDVLNDYAVKAHIALGCRGVSRADFRLDDQDPLNPRAVILEVNTQPGMTRLSLVPEMAEQAGLSFETLVSWMVENAKCDN